MGLLLCGVGESDVPWGSLLALRDARELLYPLKELHCLICYPSAVALCLWEKVLRGGRTCAHSNRCDSLRKLHLGILCVFICECVCACVCVRVWPISTL